jgi:hypothetical protein
MLRRLLILRRLFYPRARLWTRPDEVSGLLNLTTAAPGCRRRDRSGASGAGNDHHPAHPRAPAAPPRSGVLRLEPRVAGPPRLRSGPVPLCRRNCGLPCSSRYTKESTMRKLLVAALIAGLAISFEAKAQERAGSAALGAVSGAIVLGPGPAIAHSWGVGHFTSRSSARQAGSAPQEAAAKVTPLPVAIPAEAVAGKSAPPVAKTPEIVASKTAPPVQELE